jgi:hypothetical protein
MMKRGVSSARFCFALACAGFLVGCAQDKDYEGITVSANNLDKVPYIYNAMGKLEFDGQDPVPKATKVMLAACPQGQPMLTFADAARISTGNGKFTMLIAMFTCNQKIPGVE